MKPGSWLFQLECCTNDAVERQLSEYHVFFFIHALQNMGSSLQNDVKLLTRGPKSEGARNIATVYACKK